MPRSNIVGVITASYNQLIRYIPRVVVKISKASVIKWMLTQLGINYGWLLMLLVAIL
jgi:hypothetical protein